MESEVQCGTERKRSAVRRAVLGKPAWCGEALFPSEDACVVATVSDEALCS